MENVDPYLAGGYGVVQPEEDERTKAPQFEMPQADTTSGAVESSKEWDTTLVDDMMQVKESEYSKIRSAGLSRVDASNEIEQRYNLRVAAGQDPDKAYDETMGDGSVRWDSEKFEYYEQVREKVSAISVALGAIDIDMVDIVAGKLDEKEKASLFQLGEHGVKEGWFDYYNIHTGMAYTPEGVPIRMNSGGIDDIIAANSGEMAGSIAGGIMLPMMANPYSAVPVITLGILGSMAGSASGRMGDIRANEARLRNLGVENKDMNYFELLGEGVDAAVVDGVFAQTIKYIGSKGTGLTRSLYQSFGARNTKSAVQTISELTGLNQKQLTQRAKEYAKLGGIKWEDNNFELHRQIILRNEVENNPALHGYLTKVMEEPNIVHQMKQSVKERTKDLSKKSVTTPKVDDLLVMVEDSNNAAQSMMGAVRGALDESFDKIPIDNTQLMTHVTKIRNGLSVVMNTIEERGARSALDRLNIGINVMDTNPSIGQLFEIRTAYGSLLKKIGLFDEGVARRSTRLANVDVPSLKSAYTAINDQIDTIIKNTPYLEDTARAKLLDFKNTSDALYASHMKAMNTTWVKNLSSESSTAKGSLDKLMTLGKENRSQYDLIMENMTKGNQDKLEYSMVERALNKAKVGEDGYSLKKASEELVGLQGKFSNPEALNKLESIVAVSKIFEQDPIISMLANNRMILDKLAKAGLTYKPGASLLYANWSKWFPRLQTAFVDLVEKVPILRDIMSWGPLYSSIKTSAKEINVIGAVEHSYTKQGSKTNFKDFLDRALESNSLPSNVRRSIEDLSRQYAKLASSFEGNQDEIRRFMEAVEANPRMAGPRSPNAPASEIARLRRKGLEREARELEQANRAREIAEAEAEAAAARAVQAEARRVEALELQASNLRDLQQADEAVNVQTADIDGYVPIPWSAEGALPAENVRNTIRSVLSNDYRISRNMDAGTVSIRRSSNDEILETYSVRTGNELNSAVNSIQRQFGTGTPHPANAERFVPSPAVPASNIPPMRQASQSIAEHNPNAIISSEYDTSFTMKLRNPETGELSPPSSWSVSNGIVSGGTLSLERGSGIGSKMYHIVWDGARAGGLKAQPSGHLVGANPFRMSVNMLTYAAKNGGEAPHVLIQGIHYGGKRQVGVLRTIGGVTQDLRSQPLTRENALNLADGVKSYLNNQVLPRGVNITRSTTDTQLQTIIDNHKRSYRWENAPFSMTTAKLFRDFLRSGKQDLVLSASILGALMMQQDFIDLVGGQDGA